MTPLDSARMECHPGGRFALYFAGGRLTNLTAGVTVSRGNQKQHLTSDQGVWSCLPAATLPMTLTTTLPGDLRLTLTATAPPAGLGVLLTLSLTNGGSARVRAHRLSPLLFGADSHLSLTAPSGLRKRRWGVYKQGYQSWSYAGWVPLTATDIHPRSFLTRPAHSDPSWPPPSRPGHFQSEGMLMLGCPDGGPVLLAGFVTAAQMLGRLELIAGEPVAGLHAWCESDGIALDPGGQIRSESLLVAAGPEPALIDSYGRSAGCMMAARLPERAPAVWCSWYLHGPKVKEQDLLEATIALQTRRSTYPVDVIQLDDGYQQAVGDWQPAPGRFPHGLGWLASQIRQAGFQPGLWLAPFIAQSRSRLRQERPDWFVKGHDGRPLTLGWSPDWGDSYGALDTTHPEVLAWLTELARQVTGLGYRYLKLDFLFGAAARGFRYDPQVPRARALRMGLEAIRAGAGADTFLLGCGAPLLPAIGLVDGMRIGPDTAPSWRFRFHGLPCLWGEPGVPAARNALRNSLTRQWAHGRLWANDPDAVILREGARLTTAEARTLLLATSLTGGIFAFADLPDRIGAERADWLRRALPAVQTGVSPLTLLGDQIPGLSVGRHGPWLLVLAINGGERARPLRLGWTDLGLAPDAPHHLADGWSGAYLGLLTGEADLGWLDPHDARLLLLRPVQPHPVVVSTTFHLHPAQVIAAEQIDEGALTIRLGEGARGTGQITLVLPPGCQMGRAQLEGANLLGQKHSPEGRAVLDLTAAPGAVIRLHYR